MRLLDFFRRSRIDHDIEEEIRSHIRHRADDLERSGMARAEAERVARVEFGGQDRFTEECREALGSMFTRTLIHDVRFSLRVLRKSPGFTVVAVLTLALAICANAVVFGVLNGLILRPLNVPNAESLYGIEHGNEHNMYESYPDYLDLRDRNRSFDGLAAFTADLVGLDNGDNTTRSWAYTVSGNYFDVLGIQPYLGRVLRSSDEHGPNSAPYIVLSYGYWRTHFQGDPGVLGRTVRLNKYPFTIIGITPPDFRGTLLIFSPDFFVPMVNQEQLEGKSTLNLRATQWAFMTLGHLKPGVTPEQATADLNSIGSYLEKTYPKDHGATTFRLARPGLYGNYLGGPLKAFVSGLMMLAALILVGACANLGMLFAARATDRSREIALRLALGGSHRRILRQLLTEAVLISLAGGAVGLWGSIVLLRQFSAWQPFPRYPISVLVSPDASVYAIAFALAVVSGLLFGIVPIRQVLRANPYPIVKAGPDGAMGNKISVRDVLLVAQIAICAVLVTSSIVALRGLERSLHSNFGFEPNNVLMVDTDLSIARYSGDQASAMQKRIIEAVTMIPGVESVGVVGRPPLAEGSFGAMVFNDSITDLTASQSLFTGIRYNISPEYFHAAGTSLLAGRVFSWHDDKDSSRVAIVNAYFAGRVFGSITAAVGGYFKLRDGSRIQVVGVVEDGKYQSLTEDPTPALFFPIMQAPISETWIVVRSAHDPDQIAAAVRATIRGLDAGLPVYTETWTKRLDTALFASRMATASLGVLGLMGAMLSITGIFGMAAYSVSRRQRELGIRIALGAQRQAILRAALGRAFRLMAFGSAAGLLFGILASGVLSSIVYQATPRDPVVLAAVAFAMLFLDLLATWIPAQRALSIDPLKLLREE